MISEKYKIFGKVICVNFNDSYSSLILRDELSIYPVAGKHEIPDLIIDHNRSLDFPNEGLRNPSIHQDLKDGFIADFGLAIVKFSFNERGLYRLAFCLQTTSSKIKKYIQKIRNIQYSSTEESIGQIFHELVLIPSVYFQKNLFLIHASALKSPKGDITLIGGTGGVGKTSLEMELCLKKKYQFVADDICVVSEEGWGYSNLAYPKIYAYNLENNPQLTERIFNNYSLLNRLHWSLHKNRGINKVRRRVSPKYLYGSYSQEGGLINKYIILARGEQSNLEINNICSDFAACLSLPVIEAEYNIFHNHILWHQFNSLLQNKSPYVSLRELMMHWQELAKQALHNADCFLIKIPVKMKHEKFKEQLSSILVEGK